MSEKTGTFLVTEVDDGSAILRDVTDGQIHTLSENPGVERHEVLEATVTLEPPMEVTYELVEVDARRTIERGLSDLEPTKQARDTAADQADGELTRIERAGEGEVHVLTVPDPETAASDVLDDVSTVEQAARIGAVEVEVRTGDGMISVRYLPD